MPFNEDELLPLSALQHLVFCERRAALVHVERIWDDNRFTADGRNRHESTDKAEAVKRGDLVTARGVPLRSLRLGLSGKADVVEFHRIRCGSSENGAKLPGQSGNWLPYPVEHKRGKLRREEGYEIQVCAQALCLEEMLDLTVPEGAVFYAKTARRLEVKFSSALREGTERAAERLHELLGSGETPPARPDSRCGRCSLRPHCLPDVTGGASTAREYIATHLLI